MLTFPFPLRFLLAVQPEALTQMLAAVQRFGSALNLIQHLGNGSCVALPPASLQSCTCCSWTGPAPFAATGRSSTARADRFKADPCFNVITWATTLADYFAIVIWLVFQISQIVVPALNLPTWVNSLVVVMGLLGFPIAATLAWIFDLTPSGLERESGGAHRIP